MYQSVASILALSLCSVACTRELPPPAAPPRQHVALETLPEGPIPAGSGRVLLDAEPGKGAVQVVRVDLTEMSVSTTRGYARGVAVTKHLVCSKTPCAVDLPAGSHELVFQGAHDERDVSAATFDVTAGRTQVVRHSVGFFDAHGGWKALGVVGVTIGGASAVSGGLGLALGSQMDSDGLRTVGTVMLGGGLAVLALGITSFVVGRTEVKPGATTQWTLPQDGTQERPAAVQGEEHVRRERKAKPTVVATGAGLGLTW